MWTRCCATCEASSEDLAGTCNCKWQRQLNATYRKDFEDRRDGLRPSASENYELSLHQKKSALSESVLPGVSTLTSPVEEPVGAVVVISDVLSFLPAKPVDLR